MIAAKQLFHAEIHRIIVTAAVTENSRLLGKLLLGHIICRRKALLAVFTVGLVCADVEALYAAVILHLARRFH